MPAVLRPEDWPAWLSPDTPVEDALALIGPAAGETLEAVPVSTRVNAVANDDAGLIGPAEPQPARSEAGGETEAQLRLL